jgi:hypothetical protein
MSMYMRKTIAWMLILVLITLPALAYAQRTRSGTQQTGALEEETGTTEQAVVDAQLQAEKDVNKCVWFGCALAFSIYVVGAAYLFVSSPDESMLVGKSPEYVMMYNEMYKARKRSIQARYAIYGCLTSTIIAIATILIVSTQEEINCFPNYSCGFEGCGDENSSCTEE